MAKAAKVKEQHDPIHVVVYGESGSGKSTFLSTFPSPMLVLQFDPVDKSGPYLRTGIPQAPRLDEHCIVRDILTKTGKLKTRVEYYHDVDLGRTGAGRTRANAYQSFRKRVDSLYDELSQWATVIIDSVTYMEIAARKLDQYVLNAGSKEPRQWYAASTETLEEMLMCVFANFPCNVGVSAHISTDRKKVRGIDDTLVMTLAAPGRLARAIPSGYGEVYHCYLTHDDDGQIIHQLQTEASDEYVAGSQIQAPNPVYPDYRSLWTPRDGAKAVEAGETDGEAA